MIRDFVQVSAAFECERGVSRGRMFGSKGLKVRKQVFAMGFNRTLVRQAERRTRFAASGCGARCGL